MKKIIFASILVFGSGSAMAQWAVTDPISDILHFTQFLTVNAKDVNQYIRQGLQYEAQLKNLIKNPSSSLSGDVRGLIRGMSGVMSAGQSIGGSLAQIDKNFSSKFNNNSAVSYSARYSDWTATSKDTLQGAMKAAGLRRDQYASDADALSALYDESQRTEGNVAALQTLAKVNVKQVEQMHVLGDLIASQNIAANTYMAAQNEKDQARQNSSAVSFKAIPLPPENTYKTPKF